MFKFDFSKDSNSKQIPEKSELVKWVESKEIVLNKFLTNKIIEHTDLEYNTIKLDGINIIYVDSKNMINILKEHNFQSDILQAEQDHSDLISGIYEGGLKIWECTYDLTQFIIQKQFVFENKHVLDLGCGMGIIGMLAIMKGAQVDFQDYNSDVIQHVTMSNVVLTTKCNESLLNKSRFYCGDWESFVDISNVQMNKYDYIFTSETIYNTINYCKLIKLFKTLLKRDGKIYLAAKSYYFGVGGGTRQFEDCLKEEGMFIYSTVWKCGEGINKEILEISLKT